MTSLKYCAYSLNAGYLRLQTHIQNMYFFFTFHEDNGCTNEPRCYFHVHFPVCSSVNIYCFNGDYVVWIDVISDIHSRHTWLSLWQFSSRITTSTWCNRCVHYTCAWNLDISRPCGWACLFVCERERGCINDAVGCQSHIKSRRIIHHVYLARTVFEACFFNELF